MKKSIIAFLWILLAPMAVNAARLVERMEPASWWIGMKNPDVQLMLYGKNIATYRPTLNYPGVTLKQVASLENPNYLFITLSIAPTAKPGTVGIELKKANDTQKVDFTLLERRNGSAERKGFDGSDVIYLITPDRFANGNPSNDTTHDTTEKTDRKNEHGRHGGDIQGIINHLDYIRDMGFTAIWNMPLLENNQPQYSYHGYAISDFYKVDPRFGTNADFSKLSAQAKDRGIKTIMDVVLNHCGIAHWWMKDLPSKDWINFPDNYQQTNHRRETHQDPHASQYDKTLESDGWFVPTMPDLNQRNPFMATYLIQNTIWWIEYADLGGLRVDTYPYSDKAFLTEWSRRVMEEYPHLNVVGEEWSLNPALVAFWQRGKQNANGYVSHLPSLMDFPLQAATIQALTSDDARGLEKLYEVLANDFLYPEPDNLVIFLDNHDMSRYHTQIKENLDLYKMGLVYLLTTRGIPQIYYGTEILATNPKSDSHGEIRMDFPGGWTGDKTNAFAGKGLSAKEQEAQAFMRKLLNWRKNTTAIHQGKLIHYGPEQGAYVYFRYDDKGKYMIVLNKNKDQVALPLAKYSEVPTGQRTFTDVLSGEKLTNPTTVPVAARGFRILKVE
ncbi:glycoside hydrolase family 13 protein [Telluribacter humicola]|uniref:glycoside hydrolase family 13 protein n=1 Tax=Telluribacter humicola TaxID=1720261 RepID=UPI001A972705|nr:glycoside hydrolase family 13 protein [Telluribacter humicola]